MFSTKDGKDHPLKGDHAVKKASTGEYLLAGRLPEKGAKQHRKIKIPVGAKVFVPVDNVLCTEKEGDPTPLDTKCAKPDADGAKDHVSATLNGEPLETSRIHSHNFKLNISELINGTRKNKKGDPLGPTNASADGYYTTFELPPFPKGKDYHELEIKGRDIWLIYQIE